MRTFDYTHILNNLRFHISNSGFDHVRTEAFLQVSEIDHDILPKTIVELKMDYQNCSISQRFFSEDVQKILTQLGYRQEAKFVELVLSQAAWGPGAYRDRSCHKKSQRHGVLGLHNSFIDCPTIC